MSRRRPLHRRSSAWVTSITLIGLVLAGCREGSNEPGYLAGLVEGRVLDDAEVDALVEAVLDHYGGRERWASLQFRMQQDVFLKRTGDPMSNAGVRTTFSRPDGCFRQTLKQRSGEQERLLDHGVAWMALAGGDLTRTTGDNHTTVWWEYETSRIVDLLGRASTRVEASAAEVIEVSTGSSFEEEVTVFGLKVLDGQRPELTIWIDPRTREVRRAETTLPLGANVRASRVSMRVRQDYSRFDRYQGVCVPRRIDVYSEGNQGALVKVALVELHEFEIATLIDDAVFAAE